MTRLLAFVLVSMAFLLPATAQTAPEPPRTLTISASGEVTAVPDIAMLTMGVEVSNRRSGQAMTELSREISAVFDVLEAAGITERDMQTSGLSLSPIYEQLTNGRRTNTITGYVARSTLTVRVRDLEAVGGVIDAVATVGANRFQGISFLIDDTDALMDEARRRAALNAKSRAALLAEALDVDIVGVLSIAEHAGTSPRRPQMMAMADAAMESRLMPLAAGESTLSATVSVTYEIADK